MVIHSSDGFSQGQNGVQNNREMIRDSKRNEKKVILHFPRFRREERMAEQILWAAITRAREQFFPSSSFRHCAESQVSRNTLQSISVAGRLREILLRARFIHKCSQPSI